MFESDVQCLEKSSSLTLTLDDTTNFMLAAVIPLNGFFLKCVIDIIMSQFHSFSPVFSLFFLQIWRLWYQAPALTVPTGPASAASSKAVIRRTLQRHRLVPKQHLVSKTISKITIVQMLLPLRQLPKKSGSLCFSMTFIEIKSKSWNVKQMATFVPITHAIYVIKYNLILEISKYIFLSQSWVSSKE